MRPARRSLAALALLGVLLGTGTGCGSSSARSHKALPDENSAYLPDVVGDKASSAQALLKRAKFKVRVHRPKGAPPVKDLRRCLVVDQRPQEGKKRLRSRVRLSVDCSRGG